MFTIATWNMDNWKRSPEDRAAAWDYLESTLSPDLALLQETIPPDGRSNVIWRGEGIDQNRPWASAVASFEPSMTEVTHAKGRYDKEPKDLHRTHPGTLAIAEVDLPAAEPVTVVSMYGLLDGGYATTTIHRLLSDLNPLLDAPGEQRIILGGDLNCSTQFEPPYRRVHENLFERFRALGLVNLTDATKAERPKLASCPCGNPDCGHVQTHRHSQSDKPWQIDYLFASQALGDDLYGVRVVDQGSPSAWEFSDHCPIVASFQM